MVAKWLAPREGELSLEGDLTFNTIPALCQMISSKCSLLSNLQISLAKVERCDTASLVLLLSVIEHFNNSEFNVCFVDIPKAMHTLINLYNLQSIISGPYGE